MSEWQPISTAPRDGTPILIWQPDNERVVKWEGHEFDDDRYAIGYWRAWSNGWGNRNSAHVYPTHWMPLPEPPEES